MSSASSGGLPGPAARCLLAVSALEPVPDVKAETDCGCSGSCYEDRAFQRSGFGPANSEEADEPEGDKTEPKEEARK